MKLYYWLILGIFVIIIIFSIPYEKIFYYDFERDKCIIDYRYGGIKFYSKGIEYALFKFCKQHKIKTPKQLYFDRNSWQFLSRETGSNVVTNSLVKNLNKIIKNDKVDERIKIAIVDYYMQIYLESEQKFIKYFDEPMAIEHFLYCGERIFEDHVNLENIFNEIFLQAGMGKNEIDKFFQQYKLKIIDNAQK